MSFVILRLMMVVNVYNVQCKRYVISCYSTIVVTLPSDLEDLSTCATEQARTSHLFLTVNE